MYVLCGLFLVARGLKRMGEESCIFPTDSCKIRTEEIQPLKISVLPLNSPKMGDFQPILPPNSPKMGDFLPKILQFWTTIFGQKENCPTA